MKLEFEISKSDYKKAYKEYLISAYRKNIWYYLLISVAAVLSVSGFPINWTNFIIFCPIILILLILAYSIPSFYNIRKNNKLINSDSKFLGKKIIETSERGFVISTDNPEIINEYMWGSIKRIVNLQNFVFLVLTDKRSILINKATIDNIDIINFIELQKQGKFLVPLRQFKPSNPYAIGLLGIIPNVGVVVGIILLIMGFKRNDKKFIYVGIADIAFTVIFWLLFIQFLRSSGDFKKAEINSTNYLLTELVKEIKLYKNKNGVYPDSLAVLSSEGKLLFTHEVFSDFKLFGKSKEVDFFYQKLHDDFILKSYGPDRLLNTKDDIIPKR